MSAVGRRRGGLQHRDEWLRRGAHRPFQIAILLDIDLSATLQLQRRLYPGQILVLTYPLVGSYGVPAPRAPGSPGRPYESDHVQVQGLVVQS
jgi:Carbamoyl-phosphate synthase small chain, CPSase domain